MNELEQRKAEEMEMVVMLNEPVSVAGIPSNIYCMLRDLFIVREAVRSILKSRKGSRVALICNDSFLLVAAGVVTLSLESSHPLR